MPCKPLYPMSSSGSVGHFTTILDFLAFFEKIKQKQLTKYLQHTYQGDRTRYYSLGTEDWWDNVVPRKGHGSTNCWFPWDLKVNRGVSFIFPSGYARGTKTSNSFSYRNKVIQWINNTTISIKCTRVSLQKGGTPTYEGTPMWQPHRDT